MCRPIEAKIPIMVMETKSSIRVKPFFIIILYIFG